ncbi:MAG: hypothetical protein GVY10_06745 [Verrucomicrobia bacterium]|jgi:hypothetical protein|nr:hypothetical protein [Verrucomicrobiota bacterium]
MKQAGEGRGVNAEAADVVEVLITSTPITVQGDALVERFPSAVKTGYNVNGWKPVDDVTLYPRPAFPRPLLRRLGRSLERLRSGPPARIRILSTRGRLLGR